MTLSSFATRNKLFASCAIAMSGLLLSATVPVMADDAEVDSWIKDSGADSQTHKTKQANDAATAIRRNDQLTGRAVSTAEKGGDDADYNSDQNPLPAPKKIAQVLPPAVMAAMNAAAPGATPSTPMLKGGVTYCVPSGTPLKLKLATIPMPELRGEIKDMEGKLLPAQLDQIVTAKITEDIYVDDNKVIPEGTIFHGKVSKINAPRHVGRDGSLELSFDWFKTPDGRTFAFKAEADNFHESTMKTKSKGALVIAEHAAGGAAVGVIVAYKLFGLQNTIAMHGYNIAGGAAIGAAGGIAWALWRRGEQAVLEPGDEFKMSINKDLLIPGATAPTPKAPPIKISGFSMEVLSKKTIKDGFGGQMIRLDAMFTNESKKTLKSIDLFLQDDLGTKYPVSPDVDEDAQEIFTIQPYTRTKIVCTFAVEFPKLKYKAVWLDHHTHEVIFEQKL